MVDPVDPWMVFPWLCLLVITRWRLKYVKYTIDKASWAIIFWRHLICSRWCGDCRSGGYRVDWLWEEALQQIQGAQGPAGPCGCGSKIFQDLPRSSRWRSFSVSMSQCRCIWRSCSEMFRVGTLWTFGYNIMWILAENQPTIWSFLSAI